ncbi:MAG: sigma-70 family RNA polymerase sigma factor [Marinilabiliales bacterium]|nr:sigma-70 family RNA polymerase sigma factor [Marinilabiliales bacterium]
MEEQELIRALVAGEPQVFREIIDFYKDKVFRTCMGFVHQREDAEDLTQEVFIQVFGNIRSFREGSAFSTWIYRIAVNASLNHLRKKKRLLFPTGFGWWTGASEEKERTSHHETSQSPEEEMLASELSELIDRSLATLPEKQRIAFTLSKYEELSQKEISAIMELTEGAVESLIFRAKKNLQERLLSRIKN